MPNHCENDLFIRGSEADVAAVLAFVGMTKPEPEFDCSAVIPYPEKFKQMDEESKAFAWGSKLTKEEQDAARAAYRVKWGTESDGYTSGGYDWCCENWGTKWGAYDVVRRDYRGDVVISFQSAWSPPSPVIVALAKRFPTVTFELAYFERGQEFCGGFTCCSKDDYCDEENPWQPGLVVDEWRGEYRGSRGG